MIRLRLVVFPLARDKSRQHPRAEMERLNNRKNQAQASAERESHGDQRQPAEHRRQQHEQKGQRRNQQQKQVPSPPRRDADALD